MVKICFKFRHDLFPTVDFILQFATGTYEKRNAYFAIKRRGIRDNKDAIPVQPATVQDVLDFRRVAFTEEGHINAFLVRETDFYVEAQFKVGSSEYLKTLLENNRVAFLYLQDALWILPCENPRYVQWDGSVGVVADWKWYL